MLYWLMKWIFDKGPFLRLFFRPKVKGLQNIPAEGEAILASNHLSPSPTHLPAVGLQTPDHVLGKSVHFNGKEHQGFLHQTVLHVRGPGAGGSFGNEAKRSQPPRRSWEKLLGICRRHPVA